MKYEIGDRVKKDGLWYQINNSFIIHKSYQIHIPTAEVYEANKVDVCATIITCLGRSWTGGYNYRVYTLVPPTSKREDKMTLDKYAKAVLKKVDEISQQLKISNQLKKDTKQQNKSDWCHVDMSAKDMYQLNFAKEIKNLGGTQWKVYWNMTDRTGNYIIYLTDGYANYIGLRNNHKLVNGNPNQDNTSKVLFHRLLGVFISYLEKHHTPFTYNGGSYSDGSDM